MKAKYFPKVEYNLVTKPEDWYIRYDGTRIPSGKLHYFRLADIKWELKLGRNKCYWFLKTIGLLGYNNKPNVFSPWFRYIKIVYPKSDFTWFDPTCYGKDNTYISDEGLARIIQEYVRLRNNGANI